MKDPNSLPQDPMLAELVSMARRKKITRRAVFAGMGGTAAAFALAGCAQEQSDLVWHNWDLYMDEDDEGNRPTLQRFTEQTGIRVDYKIEIDDNDTYFGKVKDQLELGQDIGA
ncbi:MAG: spermidine/putrescine ABC transporter substrate-binding protein, partial [Actinobacteria bacterium]|nr:spermidine/putrescine ABC transporter substrate-binding protein [Actinomycetota bacterium]